jgi:hypothetical protein
LTEGLGSTAFKPGELVDEVFGLFTVKLGWFSAKQFEVAFLKNSNGRNVASIDCGQQRLAVELT